MSRLTAALLAVSCLTAGAGFAQEHLTEAKASFIFNGERIQITRDNPEAVRFVTHFASSGDACGAPCIAPMQVADGVATFGENDVLEFLVKKVAGNSGLMVDARMPKSRARGYIPGTVNLPFATLEPDNNFKKDILKALGAREFDGVFNFTDARELLVYDNGPSTDDAGALINNLLAAGYPVAKIRYYRGGMQVWSVLGFSIEESTYE